MVTARYTEELKVEAVKQVTDRGHAVAEVAARLGATDAARVYRAASIDRRGRG